MEEIKYHPLVDGDSSGEERIPMFFTTDQKTVRNTASEYLEEMIPDYYRLFSVNGTSAKTAKAYNIHCPICGNTMKAISSIVDEHRLSLYCCPICKPNRRKEL